MSFEEGTCRPLSARFTPSASVQDYLWASLFFLLAGVLFVVDTLTPRGIAVWIGYVVILQITYRARWRNLPIFGAAVCSILVLLGFVLSRQLTISPPLELLLRLLGILAIWATAYLLIVSRQTSELHRVQEERFHLMLDAVKDYSMFMLDPAGSIITWNNGAERIDGYTPVEAIGRPYSLLYVPEDVRDGTPERILQQAAELGQVEEEGWRRRKDGTTYWANGTLTAMFGPGKEIRGFVRVTRDLTERRAMEEQLRQSQKMEAFGQLAGGIAHDFNKVITVVVGYAELLLNSMARDDKNRPVIEQMKQAGERAASLTRQILAFSRRQMLVPKIVDINEIVMNMEDMLQRLIGEDIQIETNLALRLPAVNVDATQMEQVVMNLALNARQAMPDGGRLAIQTGSHCVSSAVEQSRLRLPEGDYIVLSVEDSGCGIAPENIPRIFEPFFTTKSVGEGTGLGLSVVQGIIQQSGGSIDVHSEVGVGTTFTIYLPAYLRTLSLSTAPSSRNLAARGEVILVVEDDESIRRLIQMNLKNHGYEVLLSANGIEAIGLMQSEGVRVDLVVTDVVMPGMSGGALIETLRVQYPRLKALFISGYNDDAIVHHGVSQEDEAFLAKPFTSSSLAAKVRDVLDS